MYFSLKIRHLVATILMSFLRVLPKFFSVAPLLGAPGARGPRFIEPPESPVPTPLSILETCATGRRPYRRTADVKATRPRSVSRLQCDAILAIDCRSARVVRRYALSCRCRVVVRGSQVDDQAP